MLIVHLAFGLLRGLASAVRGWSKGYPVWAVLGLYVLGGNVGVAGGAAVLLLRA